MTLPRGWEAGRFEELISVTRGVTFSKEQRREVPAEGFVACLRSGNVQDRLTRGNLIYVPDSVVKSPERYVRKNDTIVSMSNSYELVGKVALATDAHVGMTFGAFLSAFRSEALEGRFLFNLLRSPNVQSALRATVSQTVNISNLSIAGLCALPLPVPPLAEQRRIVAKLDALTARLARARAELDRVPVLTSNLRRSTLVRAFSGALTAQEAEEPRHSTYPTGWQVRELGHISEIQGGIQVGKKRPSNAVLVEAPYLRVANVQRGWLKLEEIKTLSVTAEERDRLTLRNGDILMNEGGDRDKLGRGWVWRDQVAGCIHQNHVFRIRLSDPDFPPEFVSHFANEFGQQYFIDQGTQTTNLASISKTKVAALPVPIPPTDEAKEIVRLINATFARADRLEAEAARARALLDRLEAAILARAFRGELVPQDPEDEPASVLLDRIRARRAAAPKPKRGRKTKGNADA